MSMMILENPKDKIMASSLSKKARNMSMWLDKDTEEDYGEINVIRNRLTKLEN